MFLGLVDDETKARALRSADVYCAPNLGGESFGIVLVEAMAAGAAVLASDLNAFSHVDPERALAAADHADVNLPFGGVNNSGIGNSHGYFGFKAFSHERAVVKASKLMMVRLFFPPYDENRRKIIRMTVDSMKWPML